MTAQDDLRDLGDHFGILPAFWDFKGQERFTSDDTRRAFLAANGVDVSNDMTIGDTLKTIRADAEHRWFPEEIIVESHKVHDLGFGLGATWQLFQWDTRACAAQGQAGDFISLPPLAPDVYEMRISVAGRVEHVRVLSAPKQLPLIRDLRPWGMTAALYALQSAGSTGLGDYNDLGTLCETMGKGGASFVGINPVHNRGYVDTKAISPYSPSHRGFYNTDYISLDHIDGLDGITEAAKIIAKAKKSFGPLVSSKTVQYLKHWDLHKTCVEALFIVFVDQAAKDAKADFGKFVTDGGTRLARFALFEALSETYGSDWHVWPETAGNHTDEIQDRIEFHSWLQWVANGQLAQAQARSKQAGMPLGLYLDLSVGARRDGAEAWCEQDCVAKGVSVGAPPDHLGPDGQNWNLVAFAPRKLQAAGYGPLRQVLSQTMRHAGVIRIDHVLGLNRSFWIPDDGSAGAYIQQPFDALLAIIKIEAWKAGAIVIGEDLGLVPDGFRDQMREQGFYGYSVLQYEKEHDGNFKDPKTGPSQVLSCFATHDTPTIQGYATALDVEWWEDLNIIDENTAQSTRSARAIDVDRLHALSPRMGQDDLGKTVHETLAQSSATMICVQLDDIFGEIEAQNLPGTIDEHPNWQRKHRVLLEDLGCEPAMTTLFDMMTNYGRSSMHFTQTED